MGRSAVGKALQAADTLGAFMRSRPLAGDDAEGSKQQAGGKRGGNTVAESNPPGASTRSRLVIDPLSADPYPVASTLDHASTPLRLPHSDWLLHRLVVTGSAAGMAAFSNAASGAGTIPWRLDLDSLEEDWCHLLVSPAGRELSLAGARVLARQLREAVEHRHAVALSRVGQSRVCPLDLHALVPVPAGILHLGPDHPIALDWLWQHWGTTQALRHVAPDTTARRTPAGGQPPGAGNALRLMFWSADWTPWRAFQRVRMDWPTLRFDVQPDYAAS